MAVKSSRKEPWRRCVRGLTRCISNCSLDSSRLEEKERGKDFLVRRGKKYVDTIRFRPSISVKLFVHLSLSLCLPRHILQRAYYYIYLGVDEGGWITRRKGVVSHELLRFRRACSRFFHRFIRISSLLLRLLSLLNLLLTGFRDVSIRCIIYAIPCSRFFQDRFTGFG